MTAPRPRKESANVRRTWLWINSALAVVIVAGVAAAGWFGYQYLRTETQTGDRGAIVDAASEAIKTMFKISPATVDADLAKGEELTTGELLDEWVKKEDAIRESVKSQSASRTSEILKAAFAKGDSDSATILLAVDTVTSWDAPVQDPDADKGDEDKNCSGDKPDPSCPAKDSNEDGIPDPVTDHYRVKAEMSLVDDKWLLSNLEVA